MIAVEAYKMYRIKVQFTNFGKNFLQARSQSQNTKTQTQNPKH